MTKPYKEVIMTEKEQLRFYTLLEKFIDSCGLDAITACKQAQKLKDIIDDK